MPRKAQPEMDAVTLTVVGDEMEAEALCGLLRTNGIECAYRRTNLSAGAALSAGFCNRGSDGGSCTRARR
jgi:hypothetical protein